MTNVNDLMRDTFLARMAAVGKPLQRVEGLHRATQLYRLPDGKTVLIRTNKKHRAIIARANGPKVKDQINIEKHNADFIGAVVHTRDGKDFDCFLIPLPEVTEVMRADHEPHVKKHPDTTSTVRVIKESHLDGRFGECRIGAGEPVTLAKVTAYNRTAEEVIAEARRMIAQAVSRPESAVSISIAY